MPGLAEDERFRTNPSRVAHRDVLVPIVAGIIAGKTTDEWVAVLETANVPGGPINTIDRVFADAQVRARGAEMALKAKDGTLMPSVANPIRYSKTGLEYDRAPPLLGQDTDDVLREVLGLDADDLSLIHKSKALG